MLEPLHVAIAAGLGVPAAGAAAFWIRYLLQQGRCLALFKQRLTKLEEAEKHADDTHAKMWAKMTEISEDMHRIMGKLDIK